MSPNPRSDDEWMEEEEPQQMTTPRQTWVSKCRWFFLQHWRPRKIEAPQVDPSLPQLTGIERSAEVMRHSMLSLEYWLSPKGRLREWLRFNAKIASILAIPSLLVVPLITFAIGQFNTWVTLLAQTATNLLFFPLSALLLVALISALAYFGKSLRRRRDPRDVYNSPYYN